MRSDNFLLLMIIGGMIMVLLLFTGIPFILDHAVSEDGTWEFHNSIVQDKYIKETTGVPFGNTQYYIQIDNHTLEVSKSIFSDIIPNNTWYGYYKNNETGEITDSWHI